MGVLIGGPSSEWLVLVAGLGRESSFSGEYRDGMKSATAVTEDTHGRMELRHVRHGHGVYLLDVSKVLSANAGAGSVEIGLRSQVRAAGVTQGRPLRRRAFTSHMPTLDGSRVDAGDSLPAWSSPARRVSA